MIEENVLLEMMYDRDEMETYINTTLGSITEAKEYYFCSEGPTDEDKKEFKVYYRIYWYNSSFDAHYKGVSIEICDLEEVLKDG